MKETKEDTRGYTKPRYWQDLESKWSLPSSRPSLARYALEYGGALRMIRVFVFSNDLMPSGGQGLFWFFHNINKHKTKRGW